MRLSRYNQFIKESNEDIDSICQILNISDYKVNKDGSIDVNGGVFIDKQFNKIPLNFNKVFGYFQCSCRNLTSLEGCPRYVEEWFDCSVNNLSSLIGGPEYVGKDFLCYSNKLTSFEYFPEFFEGLVYIDDNPVDEVLQLFKKNDKAIYWINEFDVIRNGSQVVIDRLEEVFIQMNLEIPENIKFKNYEII